MVIKYQIGTVISDKMEKTIVVKVENRYQHSLYSKIVVKNKKYFAHDKLNKCRIGDQVVIKECRPLSKKKRWELVKIF